MLRLPKLLRLLRLMKLLKVSKLQRLWRRWEQFVVSRVRYGVLRMVRFAVVILVVVHWGACLWFLLHEIMVGDDGESTTSDGTATWVTTLSDVDSEAPWRLEELYVASVYWCVMTLTTIGYGDISANNTAERAFGVLAMFVGAALFSFALSEMTIVIAALQVRSHEALRTRTSRAARAPGSAAATSSRASLDPHASRPPRRRSHRSR